MRTLSIALLCTLALALAAPVPVAAASLAGVTLPDKVEVDGQPLVLNGLGLRSKFGFKVYVAGLYLPNKERSAQKVLGADVPRRMVLSFLRDVGKDDMCDAWNEGLEANTPNASAQVKKDFATLCGYMGDVAKGQQMVFTYVPGTGTRVEVAGKAKGTIAGKATADAILATWLGPEPGPGEGFKKAVLGG